MTEQENEFYPELEWIKRHGVKFLQMVLWELGFDEEPEKTLIEVLKTVHAETGLYVFDFETARAHISFDDEFNYTQRKSIGRARQERINVRQERIKARLKRKIEAVDDDDPLPW